jgi:hypothetical protein
MLPLIDMPNTDTVDSGRDIPSGTGENGDPDDFQASLGDALGAPYSNDQSQPANGVGENLPPAGNKMPGESLLPVPQQGSSDLIRQTDDTVDAADVTEGLELDDPLYKLQIDGSADGLMQNVPSMWRESGASTLRLQADSHYAAQMRDTGKRPLSPRDAPVLNAQTAGADTDRPAIQPIDLTSRVATVDPLMSAEAKNAAPYTGSAVSVDFNQLAEKFDVLQKRTNVAGSQPTAAEISPLQGASQSARIAQPPALQASIHVPVQDDAWGEALNERVLWMAGKSIQRAEIRLNPANMGPIRVDVSIEADVATVTFSAQHAVTREAIESAMPRLREMLSENGISLANTNVSDTDVQNGERDGENEAFQGEADDLGSLEDTEVTLTTSLASRSVSALVDTFV